MIPPRDVHPAFPPLLRYRYIYTGEKALRTLLSYFAMLNMPIPPIKMNHRKTNGAKSQETLSVP